VTFEFDDDASVVETATLRAVSYVGTEDASEIRDLIVAAISGAPTLDIEAGPISDTFVTLRNTTPGLAGNQTITQGGGAPLTVDGMSGALAAGYVVDGTAGHVDFTATYASQPVTITYRPLLEWQILAEADDDDVEICVKVGNEDKQLFTLTTANVSQLLTIQVDEEEEIHQIHVTARRADDSSGAFTVKFGDWQPRGSVTSAIRYTLSTGAEVDYDWCSSGIIFKPLWPTIELLRARLDGDSILSKYLDSGKMFV
jgi:hypothetical protein